MYKIFSELTSQIDQAGLTDEQRERETEAKLSELRALSIVADDWGRKAENEGRATLMPDWMDCSLFWFLHQVSAMDIIWLWSCFPWGLTNPSSDASDSCIRLSINLSAKMPHHLSHHSIATLKASLSVCTRLCLCVRFLSEPVKRLIYFLFKEGTACEM